MALGQPLDSASPGMHRHEPSWKRLVAMHSIQFPSRSTKSNCSLTLPFAVQRMKRPRESVLVRWGMASRQMLSLAGLWPFLRMFSPESAIRLQVLSFSSHVLANNNGGTRSVRLNRADNGFISSAQPRYFINSSSSRVTPLSNSSMSELTFLSSSTSHDIHPLPSRIFSWNFIFSRVRRALNRSCISDFE